MTYLTKEEDVAFHQQLLKDIPYMHRLFNKYKDPQWLEIARNLGEYDKRLVKRILTT